jgi:alkanesulfonate monooxygenase SsuD/methylene tetrahydromethanopterin reductase-like flavin-dependent oxidoreductase (luciferase family)
MNAAAAITKIAAAEAAGIRQIWMNQGYLDTLTIFAAAALKTSAVRLGTNCTDLSTSPVGFGPAGFGFE